MKSQLNIIAAESAYNLTSLESLFLGVPVLINEGCKMKEIYKKNKMVFHTKNNEINFITSFVQCINKLKKISIKNYNISNLPTGNSWSKKVSKLCNWI